MGNCEIAQPPFYTEFIQANLEEINSINNYKIKRKHSSQSFNYVYLFFYFIGDIQNYVPIFNIIK